MASFNHRITADIIPMEQDHDTEEDEDSVVPLPLLKRNLISDFDRRSVVEPSIPHERMKVFLRIRPFTEEEVERNEDQGCYDVESLRTVTTHPPPGSHFYKNMTRGLSKTTTKYTFSRIFNENTTQTEFFNSTMLCYVKDFIDGQNCVVFAYGATNSGKTYTMQGNPPDETGVLPRTLDVLFNSIGDRQVSCESDIDLTSLIGCADDASDISTATNTTSCSESSNISLAPGKESMDCEMTFHELEQRDREEGKVSMDSEQSQEKFAVLVSFAEIYKEQIYDLLVPVPKKKNARRPCLKLSEDRTGSPYIKGLKHIQVSSADEAYKLLTIGQRNLQTACTKLNHSSSRSHCIFNIKLQRMTNQENSESARVSMLTLCDLAGTERIGKTHTIGDRLKEAGNINTSHLTLGKCIEAIRHNQLHKEQKRIVPFREAKLTRLLQNFFMGRGKAAMVVNVNQLASMFDETMQVFRFSAVASKVEVHQKPVFIQPKVPVAPVPAKIPKTSIAWATPCKKRDLPEAENVSVPTETDDDDDLEEDVTVYTQENIDELLVVIEQLQANLQTEIQNKYHEGKRIRKEVCEEMMKQFAELEEEHGERIRIREQRVEELAEKRYQIALDAERAKRKTPSVVTDDDDEWVSSVFLHQERVKLEHSDEQVKKLEQKSSEQSEHISNLENDAAVKNEQVKKLEQKSLEQSEQISKLENDASVKNEQVKKLEQQSSEQSEHIQRLEQLTKKDDISSSEESDKANIIENLTQQLQQARQHIKEQEKEISELNDMLSEAGETFEQKEVEITKLKELTTEYETKMEAQSEAIRVLERAASDSKVAMETADQSLSKREDCVATLQATIRDLEGEVNKYRNKARFFEEQLVEKEGEITHWKAKYTTDVAEHSASQDALIHGFNAEISNLKTQIFQFKSQLYNIKSPLKSPGGSIKSSPDVKMKLFPMSPLNTSVRETTTATSSSPCRDGNKNINDQVKLLQSELDKNCAMIKELEHALQISKATIGDLEGRLEQATKTRDVETNDLPKADGASEGTNKGDSSSTDVVAKTLIEKEAELEQLREKTKELEPLMKDYFSTSKKLADAERKVKQLSEEREEKTALIVTYEAKIADLERTVEDLNAGMKTLEDKLGKLEERSEEVDLLNSELKDMVDRAATDLQTKETELNVLSPKLERLQKTANTAVNVDELKAEIEDKSNVITQLQKTLKELRNKYIMKEGAFQEAVEKCNEYEFKSNEKEIENQELQDELDEKAKRLNANSEKLCELDGVRSTNTAEIKHTGEELAVAAMELEKSKRILGEYKANIKDLEEALGKKDLELVEQDKQLDEKTKEVYNLQIELENAKDTSQEGFGEGKLEEMRVNEAELQELSRMKEILVQEQVASMEKIRRLESEILGKDGELNDIKENINAKLQCVEENLKEKMQKKQEKLTKKKAKIAEKETEIADIKKEFTEKFEAVQLELETAHAGAGTLQEEVSNLKNTLNAKEIEYSSLEQSYNELKESFDNESGNAKLSSAMLEIADLKSAVHTHKTHNYKLKGDLQDALLEAGNNFGEMEQYKKKAAEVKDMKVELSNVTEELEQYKLQANSVNDGLVNELKEELSSKSDELECAEKVLGEMREVLKRRDAQLEEMQADRMAILHRDEDSKQQREEDKARLETLTDRLARREEEVHKLQNELKVKISDVDRVGEVVDEKARLEEEVSRLGQEVAGLKQEVEEKNGKITEFEERLRAIHSQMSSLAGCDGDSDSGIVELDVQRVGDNINRIVKSHQEDVERCAKLSAELEVMKEAKSEIRDQLVGLNDNMKEEMDECKKLKDAEIEKLSIELEDVKSMKTDLCSQIEKLSGESDAMKCSLSDLEKVKSEKHELSAQLEKLTRDNDELQQELSETKQSQHTEIEALLCEHRLMKSEKTKLQKELENMLSEINDLRNELRENKTFKDTENELKSQYTLKEVECETLSLDLKVLKNDLQVANEKCELLEDKWTESCNRESVRLVGKSTGDCDNKALEELKRQYKAEKAKNEEYQKLLADTSEMNVLSPQTGVRRLRKEKIETENALVEAKYKISTLETKVSYQELQLRNAANTEQKQEVTKSGGSDDSLKLKVITAKLSDCEQRNRDFIKEVSQLQGEVQSLNQQLSLQKSQKGDDEMMELLKAALDDQETMLEEQAQMITDKETKLQDCEAECTALKEKYEGMLDNMRSSMKSSHTSAILEAERDSLKQQVEDQTSKLELMQGEFKDAIHALKENKPKVADLDKKLKKAVEEKERLSSVLRENNAELKAMECSLTESRKEVENLKEHGAETMWHQRMEESKRDTDKTLHELQNKIRTLQCQNKEMNFKMRAGEEKLSTLTQDKHDINQQLQEFREQRDKLVSGLEAVLKKKDMEIKQHKDIIKQMKEKEIQITQSWHDEREKIAAGLQHLNHQQPACTRVKSEAITPGSPTTTHQVKIVEMPSDTPVRQQSPTRLRSRGSRSSRRSPARVSESAASRSVGESVPETPNTDVHHTTIQTYDASPGCHRRNSQVAKDISRSGSGNPESGSSKRGSSRRGKKRRSTDTNDGLENLPPLPKRLSKDSNIAAETSVVSESDDYSSHMQIDATPTVAAKTLRRTRKRNGSTQDLSKQSTQAESAPAQRSKRNAKHRLLESFRESPMGKTSKRILDSIAETFSPKAQSPGRSPSKSSPAKSPLKEGNCNKGGNIMSSQESIHHSDASARGRGKRKLYTDNAYISDPIENTGDFVQTPPDVHKMVTRSLRSRRH